MAWVTGTEDHLMAYLAHSRNKLGRTQLLSDHLRNTAQMAARFAAPFRGDSEALAAGLLHDLGKYGDLFQRRLIDEVSAVDHWSPGASAALTRYRREGVAMALAIEGHHLGLQQAESDSLKALHPARLKDHPPHGLTVSDPDVGKLLERLDDDGLHLPSVEGSTYCGIAGPQAAAMLDVRMLYSALVDADFLDTEAHFKATGGGSRSARGSGLSLRPARALESLNEYIEDVASESLASPAVRQMRADLLRSCLAAADAPPGLFTLTAPTGAGKTLSLLAFALRHASLHDLRRIIVVIPFLSIIEQTVREYRAALRNAADENHLDLYVLEDHSLAGAAEGGGSGAQPGAPGTGRLLAENWDAPIVVTTSVQCLESLLANRPGACRKLHRLAHAVVLFDEVQTLPERLAVVTLASLSRLSERYGATIVFSTATQPAFSHLDSAVSRFSGSGWRPREIVPAGLGLFGRIRRTRVSWPRPGSQPLSWNELGESLQGHNQVLCIVNMKRHALELARILEKAGAEGLLHLSTSMCPAHRWQKLQDARRRLDSGSPCRLVSTQCIEAGVDVDFPVVYRAFGPLDAIAQAAGRCNRNGREETAVVHVFDPDTQDDTAYPDGTYLRAAQCGQMLLRQLGPERMDIHDCSLFERYFRDLYALADLARGEGELMEAIARQDFVDVARYYRVIPNSTVNVVVPYDAGIFEALRTEALATGLTRGWVRRARPYTIGVYRPGPADPIRDWLEGVPIHYDNSMAEDWFLYLRPEHYSQLTGLVPSSTGCVIA